MRRISLCRYSALPKRRAEVLCARKVMFHVKTDTIYLAADVATTPSFRLHHNKEWPISHPEWSQAMG